MRVEETEARVRGDGSSSAAAAAACACRRVGDENALGGSRRARRSFVCPQSGVVIASFSRWRGRSPLRYPKRSKSWSCSSRRWGTKSRHPRLGNLRARASVLARVLEAVVAQPTFSCIARFLVPRAAVLVQVPQAGACHSDDRLSCSHSARVVSD
jgi:hypothetical protein